MAETNHKKAGTDLPLAARLPIYLAGLTILCLGLVLSTKTGLGVSPISSVPYCVSQLSGISLGNCTIILYILFILLQLILTGHFSLKIILQLPVTLGIGRLVDWFDQLLAFRAENLLTGIALLLLAICFIAMGVTLSVGMDMVPNTADGMVDVIARKLGREFGKVKTVFDLSMMCLTILISLIAAGHLIGIGVGSVLSALGVGRVAGLFRRWLKKPLRLNR